MNIFKALKRIIGVGRTSVAITQERPILIDIVRNDDLESENPIGEIVDQKNKPGETNVEATGNPIKVKFNQYSEGPWLPTLATGTTVSFEEPIIYNSSQAPASGNITFNLNDGKVGIVQKMYHSSATEPTLPAAAVKLGMESYQTNSLNIIYFELCSNTRIEYWITHDSV